ncbi:MAG: hypothetical protein EPN84_11820 [Legionella sp.]|nr:MAG: hypothetical protein EPN84_11820 [Legionella sp.]
MRSSLTKILVFVVSFFVLNLAYSQAKVEINIGIYAPFANENSIVGRTLLVTLEALRDQINAQGINYTFYTLDQLPANQDAVKTIEKFVAAHQIKVLLTEGTRDGMFIAPIAKSSHFLHLNVGGDPKIEDGTNTFATLSPEFTKDMQQLLSLKHKMSENLDLDTLVAVQKLIKKLEANPQIFQLFQLLNQSVIQAVKQDSHCSSQQIAMQLQALSSKQA